MDSSVSRKQQGAPQITSTAQPLAVPKEYEFWFFRFQQAVYALISEKEQSSSVNRKVVEALQIFLLDHGHYNANFTLSELRRLYPFFSPFARNRDHAYIRAEDTLAVLLLRQAYQDQNPARESLNQQVDREVFFIDSPLFFDVPHHPRLIAPKEIGNLQGKGPFAVAYPKDTVAHLDSSIFLKGKGQDIVHCYQDRFKGLDVFVVLSPHNKLPPFVKNTLPKLKIQPDFGKIFNHLNRTSSRPLNHRPFLARSESIQTFRAQNKILPAEAFNGEVQGQGPFWIEHQASEAEGLDHSIFSKDKNLKIVHFYCRRIENLDVLVLLTRRPRVPDFIEKTLSHSGYRPDPMRANRALLRYYPGLFFSLDSTERFFNHFLGLQDFFDSKQKESLILIKKCVLSFLKSPSRPTPARPLEVEVYEKISKDLADLSNTSSNPFSIYARYIRSCFNAILTVQSDRPVWTACRQEIFFSLKSFLEAARRGHFSSAIRWAQNFSEIRLLYLDAFPSITPPNAFEKTIKDIFKNVAPHVSVSMTPYAMRSFVRSLQILKPQTDTIHQTNKPVQIAVTSQNYFEWLHNLERLDQKKYHVFQVQHLSEISDLSDIVFFEIHLNNVVASNHFSQDLKPLYSFVERRRQQQKKTTLVLDVTLNTLDDDEISDFLYIIKPRLQDGSLNVILIQSLTKFSQLGLDKRSAGLVVMLNDGSTWAEVNQEAEIISKYEQPDPVTNHFFLDFFRRPRETSLYIDLIHTNVQRVYQRVIQELSNLEVMNSARDRFTLSISSDAGACYVALNARGLLPEIDPFFKTKNIQDVEKFLQTVVSDLIMPLMNVRSEHEDVSTLTERMSIGFPLTSVNVVMDAIRMTIGLEPQDQIRHYIDVIAYVAFVLNRPSTEDVFDLFYDKNFRTRYFLEKVQLFEALTKNITPNRAYTLCFERQGPGSEVYRLGKGRQQLKATMKFFNGTILLYREMPKGRPLLYSNSSIMISKRGSAYVSIDTLSLQERRMVASCFTEHRSRTTSTQKATIHFDDSNGTAFVPNFESLSAWNQDVILGPFIVDPRSGRKDLFVRLYQKRIITFFLGRLFDESLFLLQKGAFTIPFEKLSLNERSAFFSEIRRSDPVVSGGFSQTYPGIFSPIAGYREYRPIDHGIRFDGSLLRSQQRIKICRDRSLRSMPHFPFNELSAYQRPLGRDATILELDYWSEKDSVLSRFSTLMIFVLLKECLHIDFVLQNPQCSRALFNVSPSFFNHVFSYAVVHRVLNAKEALKQCLKKHKVSAHGQPYRFFSALGAPAWPDGQSAVSTFSDGSLIESALQCLEVISTPGARR